MIPDYYRCRCGWTGSEEQLDMKEDGDPTSMLLICPKCGADELKPEYTPQESV